MREAVDAKAKPDAGCAAISMVPELRNYLIYALCYFEAGHTVLPEWLGARPLPDFGMLARRGYRRCPFSTACADDRGSAEYNGRLAGRASKLIPRMRRELIYFLVAIQVLTRLPVPRMHGFAERWVERGVKYFPLTGAIVGAVCAIVLLGASHLWHGVLPALLAVAAGILITGGLHEDGFADFFDSMGGATREARLAIMKDSRIGTYGALALGAGVAVKLFALSELPLWTAAAGLVAAHAGGRLATVAVISLLPYAGGISAAKIKPLGRGVTRADLAIAGIFGLLPLLLLRGGYALPALAVSACAALAVALCARRLLGGYTGDVLGAVEQIYEITFLLALAACV